MAEYSEDREMKMSEKRGEMTAVFTAVGTAAGAGFIGTAGPAAPIIGMVSGVVIGYIVELLQRRR